MDANFPVELTKVLEGLALNREPGWNFPGHFLAFALDGEAPGKTRLILDPAGHCTDADGQASLAALCILADVGMAMPMRAQLGGHGGRMATVSMQLLFTGAPRRGRLVSDGVLQGLIEGAGAEQGITRTEIRSGDRLVCAASGTFISLGRDELPAPRLRRRGDDTPSPALAPQDLDERERAVFARAQAALQPGAGSFLDRFWSLLPEPTDGGAVCDFVNGLHVGNRVGHTQGGITFALAALTANAALGTDWQLVRASASYVSPGRGDGLRASARILHQGRLTAVLRTEIRDESDGLVLESVTNHARAG